jgi:hypothetical protein
MAQLAEAYEKLERYAEAADLTDALIGLITTRVSASHESLPQLRAAAKKMHRRAKAAGQR